MIFYGFCVKMFKQFIWGNNTLKTKAFLKRYSVIALLSVLLSDLLAFYGSHLLMFGRGYHDITSALDKKIPFVPEFIIVYVLAFVQWVACYIAIAAEDKQKAYRFCVGASVANIICGIVFVAFPTVMAIRPEASGTGLVGFLTRFIFAADNPPVNLFPSMHCLESYLCIRVIFASKRVPKFLKALNLVFSIMVFAAVLLVKQHLIIDVFAGILVAELGVLLTKALKLDEKLIKMEGKLLS